MAQLSLPPLGEIRLADPEPIRRGAAWELWAGTLVSGEKVWCKTPQDQPGADGLFEGHMLGEVREARVTGHTLPLQADALADMPALLLALEAELLRQTQGAWNNRVLALGAWDLHWFMQPYLATEADGRAARRPVLVTARPRGVRFSALSPERQRALFPTLLPALWMSLSAAPHGALCADAIVYDDQRGRFTLTDPSVTWWTRRPMLRDLDQAYPEAGHDDRYVFWTVPAAYPLLPPQCGLPLRRDWWLGDYLDHLLRGPDLRFYGPLLSCATFRQAPPQDPGEARAPSLPSAADLLALGVMYFQILTGRHPLPRLAERPAWSGPFADAADGHFAAAVRLLIQQQHLPRASAFADVSPEEDELCMTLLNLHLAEGEATLRRVAAAALAARSAASDSPAPTWRQGLS